MSEKDFYGILGIDEKAGQAEIRVAYRKMALQYHPDRNKNNPAATTMMKEVNEAYAILSDPVKRQEYDQLRQQDKQSASELYRQTHTAEDIFKGSDINQIYSDLAKQFRLRNFDKVFRDAYGPQYRSFEFQNKGVHGRAFVIFDTPKNKSQGVNQPQNDPEITNLLKRVSTYTGTPHKGKDINDRITISSKAAEEGSEVELHFNYRGSIRKLRIKIPTGIREGQQIKLTGLGKPGKSGGSAGDLYLKVRISDRPRNRS